MKKPEHPGALEFTDFHRKILLFLFLILQEA